VATLAVVGSSGERHELPLRAGVEISEASLGQSGALRRARHVAADVFERESDQSGYFLSVDLPRPISGARLELRLHGTAGWMQIQRLTVVDGAGADVPIGRPDVFLLNEARWREVQSFSTSRVSDRGIDEDVPGEEEVVVLENRRARPRAWLTHEVIPLDERSMTAAVHHSYLPDGRRFDPAAMALVDTGDAALSGSTGPDAGNEVRIDAVEDGLIRVAVSTSEGGFLVLSESYYPGWRARIGERLVPVHRTNLSLQGVAVPPGQHVVTFEFASASLRAGIALSLTALVGLTLLGGWAWMRTHSEFRMQNADGSSPHPTR
jgi:hypothetical protein